MNPIEHPETIMLIHDDMIRREIARGDREWIGRGETPRPDHRNGPDRFRIAIGNGLIALARRIAPAEPADGLPAAARR